MRYELTDCEWAAIKPMLPNKPRGVPRVNDRRVSLTASWRRMSIPVANFRSKRRLFYRLSTALGFHTTKTQLGHWRCTAAMAPAPINLPVSADTMPPP